MNEEEIYAKLHAVFKDVFGADAPRPLPEMVADDVEGWDSLNHVRLIVAVEADFGVKFTSREIARLKTVGDLVALLAKKTAG